MTAAPPLRVLACAQCRGHFLPRPGACPRCGSDQVGESTIPAAAVVLAATELLAPAAGWANPHRLVLAEAAEQVRVLAIAADPLPSVGEPVEIWLRGGRYEVAAAPGPTGFRRERGEGDVPDAGRSRRPFEPPR